MNDTIDEHFARANRPVTYLNGRTMSRIETDGENQDVLIRLRSGDIPTVVRDICDVGIVGGDWLEEKQLEHWLDLEVLDTYQYGRKFFTSPKLELVVREDEDAQTAKSLRPSIVVGEYPNLMKMYFESMGWEGRVVKLGDDGSPNDPKEFRGFCQDNGLMGIHIVHGTISELVNTGAGYGVMVSETNGTKQENGLRTLDVIMDVKMKLVADPDALKDGYMDSEIRSLEGDLRRAYDLNFDPELRSAKEAEQYSTPPIYRRYPATGVYESPTPILSGKER